LFSSRQILATAPVGVVDAPPDLAAEIASALASVKGCELVAARGSAQAANLLLEQQRLSLLVVYVGSSAFRRSTGLRLTKSRQPAVPVVVLAESTFEGGTAEIVAAGAADCLLRPINLSRLTFLCDFLTLRQRTCSFPPEPAAADKSVARSAGGLVFASEAARRLLAWLPVWRVDTTVLLQRNRAARAASPG
jgi:DNA-binding response OmpR family regulator